MVADPAVMQRFWGKVDKLSADDCWLWTGATNSKGYPVMGAGKALGLVSATHISLGMSGRPQPEDARFALHSRKCTSKACVNPNHLRWGTHRDGMADVVALGSRKGKAAYRGKILSQGDIEIIRDTPRGTRGLAARLGVTHEHICNVRAGRAHPDEGSKASPASPA